MTAETAERPLWSKSQVSALRECRRKLFFTVRPTEASAELKKIRGRHLWSGSLVHEAIGDILKSVRQGETAPDEESVIAKIREKMREEFRASREGRSAAPLLEHRYMRPVAADAWKRQWETVERSLRWFMKSRWLGRLSALGPECWKAVDEVLSFDVNGIKAYAKIDVGIETEGKFFVIDWKTSAANASSEDGLQVAALYAHENWGADPEAIQAMAVSLADGSTHHAAVSEDSLMEAHLRIEEEAAELQQAAADFGTDPLTLAAAAPAICAGCSFQAICHPAGLRF